MLINSGVDTFKLYEVDGQLSDAVEKILISLAKKVPSQAEAIELLFDLIGEIQTIQKGLE